MRILADETAFLCLDNQSKLFPHIYESERLEQNINKLIQGINVIGLEILVSEQYSKALGSTMESMIELLGNSYKPIEKMSFSCMDEPNFVSALQTLNKKNIIICGIESHVCVLQTAIDMIQEGYIPIIIEDCVSSRNLCDKNTALNRMKQEGAIISSYESILFELQRYSGNEKFKLISKIIK